MQAIQNYYIALFKSGSFDIVINGVGHFFLTKADFENFPTLAPFAVVFVRPLGLDGYSVEVA